MCMNNDLELQKKIVQIVNKARDIDAEKEKVIEEARHEETLFSILRIHLYAEKELDYIIESMFKVQNLIKGFNNKLKFIYDLKLIDKSIFDAVEKLNNVRNKLAHNLNFGDSDEVYSSLKSGLSEDILAHHHIDIENMELVHKVELDNQEKTRILLVNIWIQLKLRSTNILSEKLSFSKRLRQEVIEEVEDKSNE